MNIGVEKEVAIITIRRRKTHTDFKVVFLDDCVEGSSLLK